MKYASIAQEPLAGSAGTTAGADTATVTVTALDRAGSRAPGTDPSVAEPRAVMQDAVARFVQAVRDRHAVVSLAGTEVNVNEILNWLVSDLGIAGQPAGARCVRALASQMAAGCSDWPATSVDALALMGDVCQSLALPPREVLGLADWCALLEWLDGERVLPAAYVGSRQ